MESPRHGKRTSLLTKFKHSATDWVADGAPRMGAAIAYYSMFSIPPLLVLIITIAGFIFGREAVEGRIVSQIGGLVGEEGARVIQSMMAAAGTSSTGIIATIIGLATLLLGASGVFGELKTSLNAIWDIRAKSSSGPWGMVKERLFSFSIVLGLAFVMVVSLIVSTAMTVVEETAKGVVPGPEFVGHVLDFGMTFTVITIVFACLYRFLPDAQVTWRTAFIGGAWTTLFFAIGKYLIGLYLAKSDVVSGYGAAGSVMLVMIWIYYSAQIFIFGAELTKQYVYARGEIPRLKEGLEPAREEAGRVRSSPTVLPPETDRESHPEPAPHIPSWGTLAKAALIGTLDGIRRVVSSRAGRPTSPHRR